MYHAYFGLEKEPFSMTPDPGFLFLTAKHREALAGLLFAVTSRKGFLVLTGDAGTGKTTLLSRVMRSMPSERAHFSYVLNPTLSASEFLEMVLLDFGFEEIPESKSQRLMMLQRFLIKGHREGRTLVLIIDEAQKLTPELLEEIRLLTNFETADQKLLQIILAGQTELTDLLNRQELRQLKQRIAVRVGVEALAAPEVGQYMQSRWARAGASCQLPFSTGAIKLIAMYSRGIPRVVNSICDNALMNAFGDEVRLIDEKHILEVVADLQLSPNGNGRIPVNGVPGAGISKAATRAFNETPNTFKETPNIVPIKSFATSPPTAPAADLPMTSFKTLERYMPAPAKSSRWIVKFRVPKG
jgi:general secretion pathway protein A